MFREGLLVIVSGPSGAGKGTLLELFKHRGGNVKFSVSATSRKPRAGEVDCQNYFFKTVDQFKDMIENNELIEWVRYCDNYYGTPRKHIEDFIKQGFDVILEIEVEGALNIKEKFPDSVSIFILPPSFEELRKRITGRGTEKEDIIEIRMERAKKEIELLNRYDYIVINDELEKAFADINSILIAEKLKFTRNKNILDIMQ
jgi:guanylate kinase